MQENNPTDEDLKEEEKDICVDIEEADTNPIENTKTVQKLKRVPVHDKPDDKAIKVVTSILEFHSDGIEQLLKEQDPPETESYVTVVLNYIDHDKEQLERWKKMESDFSQSKEEKVHLLEDEWKEDINDANDQSIESLDFQVRKSWLITSNYQSFLEQGLESVEIGKEKYKYLLIEKFKKQRIEYLKEYKPEFYKRGQEMLDAKKEEDMKKDKDDVKDKDYEFYTLGYVDVVLIICGIIKHFSKLKIKLDIPKTQGVICLKIYGNEEIYDNISSDIGYELQLKPYALFYKNYVEKQERIKSLGENGEEVQVSQEEDVELLSKKIHSSLQFEDMETKHAVYWPPYETFDKAWSNKFRRYTKDDLYHECNPSDGQVFSKSELDPNMQDKSPEEKGFNVLTKMLTKQDNLEAPCNNCTKYRNIDKLRLISTIFDTYFRINFLKEQKLLNTFLYNRNLNAYCNKLKPCNLLSYCWNIFSKKKFKHLIYLIRSFFGESISYYYLWLEHLIIWLIVPSIVGLIIGLLYFFDYIDVKELGKSTITNKDVILLAFGVFIAIWAAFFNFVWKEKEKLFNYFWGTENFSINEPDSEFFVPERQEDFIFDIKVNKASKVVHYIKRITSYVVLVIMIGITCTITILIFRWKKKLLKEDTDENFLYNTGISMGMAAANAVQIKIFNFLYQMLAKVLNKWENYQKDYQRINDLAYKIIIFEFMNCYTACFYIVFYKPFAKEQCVGTCISELGTQIYTTLLINFGCNFIEIGYPIIMYNIWKFLARKKDDSFSNSLIPSRTNLTDQLNVEEMDNTIYEYNEIIILFGYMTLFSVTAPFTPIIVLFLVWNEKIFDILKHFYLDRVQLISQATGIGVYNNLIFVLIVLGILCNTCILMFSKEDVKPTDGLIWKLTVIIAVENFTFLIMYFANWNYLPDWFESLQEIKDLYEKKYFRRPSRLLPHNFYGKTSDDFRYGKENKKGIKKLLNKNTTKLMDKIDALQKKKFEDVKGNPKYQNMSLSDVNKKLK